MDTSAWVALRYRPDQYHVRARSLLRKLRARALGLVTTEWVMSEAFTLLKSRGAMDQAIVLGQDMEAGRLGQLVESSRERRRRAWDLFVRYRELDAGWVDCASFAVMDELGIRHFFGFDEDFTRAGFIEFR